MLDTRVSRAEGTESTTEALQQGASDSVMMGQKGSVAGEAMWRTL